MDGDNDGGESGGVSGGESSVSSRVAALVRESDAAARDLRAGGPVADAEAGGGAQFSPEQAEGLHDRVVERIQTLLEEVRGDAGLDRAQGRSSARSGLAGITSSTTDPTMSARQPRTDHA